MKEIVTRTLYGAVFVAVIFGSILVHPILFLSVMGVAVIIAMHEFLRLFFPDEKIGKHLAFYFLGTITYLVIALSGLQVIHTNVVQYLLVVPFLLIALELFRSEGASWHHLTAYFGGILYIVLPFGMMNALFFAGNATESSPVLLLSMFVLVWANDVFAYLTGTYFGKHKLFEKVSPKKTWEGSIGGFLFTLLFAWFVFSITGKLNLQMWLILSALIVVTGTLGDLAESLLKRNAGVKDSGRLIPGHGGILDRFDATLFATPFVVLYFNLLAP